MIATLELDDAPLTPGLAFDDYGPEARALLTRYRDAMRLLLIAGPFDAAAAWPGGDGWSEGPFTVADALLLRAELLQFLRSTVRGSSRGQRSSSLTSSHATVSFAASVEPRGDVRISATGDTRAVVIVQCMALVAQVFRLCRVQVCKAPDCGSPPGTVAAESSRRLFVQVGRREFCSTQCQNRTYMRQRRENERRTRQRRADRRRKERAS